MLVTEVESAYWRHCGFFIPGSKTVQIFSAGVTACGRLNKLYKSSFEDEK